MTSGFTPEQEDRIREILMTEHGREPARDVPFSFAQEQRIAELIDARWKPLGAFLEATLGLTEAVKQVAMARRVHPRDRYEGVVWNLRRLMRRSSPGDTPGGDGR